MLVVDNNFSRVKCFLFELSGGFACAITERERIYRTAKMGRLLKGWFERLDLLR